MRSSGPLLRVQPRRRVSRELRAVLVGILLGAVLFWARLPLLGEGRSSVTHTLVLEPLTLLQASAVEKVDAPERCHAKAHTELGGGLSLAANAHPPARDAAACCEACEERSGCSVWVWHPVTHACWLKTSDNAVATLQSRASSSKSVPWTSGVVLPEAALLDARSSAAAARARSLSAGMELQAAPGSGVQVGLREGSGTLERVTPLSFLRGDEAGFSYTLALEDEALQMGEGKHMDRRGDGYHHLGDFSLRASVDGGALTLCSSVAGGQIAADAAAAARDGTHTAALEGGGWSNSRRMALNEVEPGSRARLERPCPLSAVRTVTAPGSGGPLELRLTLSNNGSAPVTLLDLGFSMPFDQHFHGHNLEGVAAQCSFVEPFLGAGGGYVQVTRATGVGPVLLLLPLPGHTSFEAWRPLHGAEDAMLPGYMYEQTYALMMHSAGYAAGEWGGAAAAERAARGGLPAWNAPTSAILRPGESRSYGFRALLSPSARRVEETLLKAGHPVATPLPGPVLGLEMRTASLLLRLPPQMRLVREQPEPAPGGVLEAGACVPAGAPGLLRCPLRPIGTGSVRLSLRLTSPLHPPELPLLLTVHYYITAPPPQLVSSLGKHSVRSAWLPEGSGDPWHRDASFSGWDALGGVDGKGGRALYETRVYMSGLSDEAGAGAALALASKQTAGMAEAEEVRLLELFADKTLWQEEGGDRKQYLQSNSDGGVRLSMFHWSDAFNDPQSALGRAATNASSPFSEYCRACWPDCNWMVCWTEEKSLETWRAYNYPHVTAVHWALYRAGRYAHPPLTQRQGWEVHLRRAHVTALALYNMGGDPWSKKAGGGVGTSQWGVMVGSVFPDLLDDLRREGWVKEAEQLQVVMEARLAVWLSMPFPYGSEFAWDSTGHEEIAATLLRFGRVAEAATVAAAVTAYVSLTPHWAYCGSARRWWDFGINGLSFGNERTFHHYAAPLNSIPLFEAALLHPTDSWLWRLAACAGGGTLTNIRPQDGSASMGWHGDPERQHLDRFSADFGQGFYGHSKFAGSYLTCGSLGWLCLSCDLEGEVPAGTLLDATEAACDGLTTVTLVPRDAFGRRVYLQPLGLMLVSDGARVQSVGLRLGEGRGVARFVLLPARVGSTHAMLTLKPDGPPGGGAREVGLACAGGEGCAIDRPPGMPGARDVWRVRLGRAGEATVVSVTG